MESYTKGHERGLAKPTTREDYGRFAAGERVHHIYFRGNSSTRRRRLAGGGRE